VQVVGLQASFDHVWKRPVNAMFTIRISDGECIPRGKMDTHVATPARPPQRRTEMAS